MLSNEDFLVIAALVIILGIIGIFMSAPAAIVLFILLTAFYFVMKRSHNNQTPRRY